MRKARQSESRPQQPALHGQHRWGGQTTDGLQWEILRGDAESTLKSITSKRYNCVVTSPPYFWQRDYGVEGQIGKESRIDEYVSAISRVMLEVKRVLTDDGLLFVNLGDTYYSAKGEPKGRDRKNGARRFGLRAVDASGLGVPRKTAIGIPWRVALQMISDGWTLRSPIIWQRKGAIPEPTAHDRPWRTYETVFMFSKSPRYRFDRKALSGEEDIWSISARPKGTNGVHYAPFPDELVERCIVAGCPKKGEVLDPFAGSGTVLRVALRLGHSVTGIDLNDKFCRYMADQLSRL